jgi:hypothetical protein
MSNGASQRLSVLCFPESEMTQICTTGAGGRETYRHQFYKPPAQGWRAFTLLGQRGRRFSWRQKGWLSALANRTYCDCRVA